MYFLKTFFILFGFWLVLSGMFDAFHITLGLLSSALVAFWSSDLLFKERGQPGRPVESWLMTLRFFKWRHIRFFLWLQWEIVVANFQMLLLALHPRMREIIDPQLFHYESGLKKDFSKFILANSITLTPGTVTVRITGGRYLIHAITPQAAGDLLEKTVDKKGVVVAEMEQQVRGIFEEDT